MNRRGFLKLLITAPILSQLPWESIAATIRPIMPKTAMGINLTLTEIISETFRKHRADIIQNIVSRNVLLEHLLDKGRIKP